MRVKRNGDCNVNINIDRDLDQKVKTKGDCNVKVDINLDRVLDLRVKGKEACMVKIDRNLLMNIQNHTRDEIIVVQLQEGSGSLTIDLAQEIQLHIHEDELGKEE